MLFHHPPFSSGPHGSTYELQWPFRAWGATAVSAGHDHSYERFDAGGMPYVVVGTGGMRLYKPKPTVAGQRGPHLRQHGALRIDVDARGRRAREFTSAERRRRDRFALPPASELAGAAPLVGSGDGLEARRRQVGAEAGLRARGFDTIAWAVCDDAVPARRSRAAAGAAPHTTHYRREFELDSAPRQFGRARSWACRATSPRWPG